MPVTRSRSASLVLWTVVVISAATAAARAQDSALIEEFGAVNAEEAGWMIKQCDEDLNKLREIAAGLPALTKSLREADRQIESKRKAHETAQLALQEARSRYQSLSGAEQEKFRIEVLVPREQRAWSAEFELSLSQHPSLEREEFLDQALRLKSIAASHKLDIGTRNITEAELSGLVDGVDGRCRRLRLWARIGGPSGDPQPAPAVGDTKWPGEAVKAWGGVWDCERTHWRGAGSQQYTRVTARTEVYGGASADRIVARLLTSARPNDSGPALPNVYSDLLVLRGEHGLGNFTHAGGGSEPVGTIDMAKLVGKDGLEFHRTFMGDRREDLLCRRHKFH